MWPRISTGSCSAAFGRTRAAGFNTLTISRLRFWILRIRYRPCRRPPANRGRPVRAGRGAWLLSQPWPAASHWRPEDGFCIGKCRGRSPVHGRAVHEPSGLRTVSRVLTRRESGRFRRGRRSRSNHDIYVKLVGPGEPLRLTTDPARDHSPAWSPDGRSIAFIRDLSDERAAVLLLPALGGAERKLTETAAPSVEWPFYGTRALAWTPDGQRLVVSDKAERTGHYRSFCYRSRRARGRG